MIIRGFLGSFFSRGISRHINMGSRGTTNLLGVITLINTWLVGFFAFSQLWISADSLVKTSCAAFSIC